MNLIFRLLTVLARSFFAKRLSVLDESVISLRVFPNDLDFYGHMNNGRYLTLMDLGRVDLILRTGLGRVAKKNGWNPLIGFTTIRFKKSLKCFHRFHLHTRIVGWDEKWFFIEQRFERKGKLMAAGLVKGLFRGPDGNASTKEILDGLGCVMDSPPVSDAVRLWMQWEETMQRL